jgi:2Fe-2S ferredoxin
LATDRGDEEEQCISPLVTIDPAGIAVAVPAGQSLMASAQQAGIRWPNVCGGLAQCGVCLVEVVEGADTLPAPTVREQQMLNRVSARPRHDGVLRLACQLVNPGSVRVVKLGVRRAPPAA